MGLADGADVGGQSRVLVLDPSLAPGDEVFQAAEAGAALVQALLDGLTPPAEASLGQSGVAVAQLDGDLGLEGAASEAGQSPGSGADQGVGDGLSGKFSPGNQAIASIASGNSWRFSPESIQAE